MMEVVVLSDVDAIGLHPMASMPNLDREVLLTAYRAAAAARFEVGRRRTPEPILAEGFHCSFNSLRTLSDTVKCIV